jgi:Helicase conserved C-terminal domain
MINNKYQRYILEGKYSELYKHYFGKADPFPGILSGCKSLTYIQVIDFGNLIADSSKLRELDRILKEKKKNGDKVLIFCQMTKMIDILEDFMNLRKYTFFRLDGASNIADRRDMVNDFQKPQSKVFVFLLSTRAGNYFFMKVVSESHSPQPTLLSSTTTTGTPRWMPRLLIVPTELDRVEMSTSISSSPKVLLKNAL